MILLRIESDGTRKNTRLLATIDDNTVELPNVSEIKWEYNEDEEFVTATIKLREVGMCVKDGGKEIL